MNIWLYRLVLWLFFPLILLFAWKHCRKVKTIKVENCFKSRFGLNPKQFKTGGIWIHAVSAGETRSIFPLLNQLKQLYPELPITLTNGSTQGALQTLNFAPVEVQHQMIPYDYPFAVNKFLAQIQPKLVLIVETEIWPNLFQACEQRKIPLMLINARLKQKSFASYQKFGGSLVKNALNQTSLIAAQFQADTDNFIQLGVAPKKLQTLGNLKFDLELQPDLVAQANAWRNANNLTNRFIWVAASTHPGEEQLMLAAHKILQQTQPNALLILVPRHAERFESVADELTQAKSLFAQRSKEEQITEQTEVYFADTIGELMQWYAACDAAFIGGSLVDGGGHNLIEPAALAKPLLAGHFYSDLLSLYQTFTEQEAVLISQTAEQLGEQLTKLAKNPAEAELLGAKAKQVFSQQTGVLARIVAQIQKFLS